MAGWTAGPPPPVAVLDDPAAAVVALDPVRSAEERAAFAEELGAAVRSLARRYHDKSVPGGAGTAWSCSPNPVPRRTDPDERRDPFDRVVGGSARLPQEVWETIATGPKDGRCRAYV